MKKSIIDMDKIYIDLEKAESNHTKLLKKVKHKEKFIKARRKSRFLLFKNKLKFNDKKENEETD